jgi:hypothetical protein
MNKKVLDYLKKTDENNATHLRNILRCYANGEIRDLLLKQNVTNLEFFPLIQKNRKSLQISFRYFNLCAMLEFGEAEYEYNIYLPNCSAEDLENSVVRKIYHEGFLLEAFFVDFMCLLNSDTRLMKVNPASDNRRTYKTIYRMCLGATLLIIVVLSAYVLITDNTIQLGAWFLCIILIPTIISLVFDYLSVRK